MLTSLDSEDLGTPGREGVIAVPTTGPHLTFGTDDPGGVKAQVFLAPQSPAEGTGVDTSLLSPSLSLPLLLLHLPVHGLWGQGVGGVPPAEEPSHDLASGHPGSQRRVWGFLEPFLNKVFQEHKSSHEPRGVSLDSTGLGKFLPTSSLMFK